MGTQGEKNKRSLDVINMVETRLQVDALHGWCYIFYFNKKFIGLKTKNIVWIIFFIITHEFILR
jgi:hypothetical protein